ncbi:MAG TPA: hypothetical protein VKZ98_08260 [Aquaticitalea sp.]|nr:hypothetical protein [Aquaticitalea sp.]
MNSIKTLFFVMVLCAIPMYSQNEKPIGNVIIDKHGVMRWEKTEEEVHGFGVNYTVPFAHAFRTAQRMGIDPKQAIDNDVYHFTRLGFDLYRVHVWDTQISDAQGHLLENEYLDAFDYLIKKLKEHNINYVITPIAFWGDGWPEPDTETTGFSHKYGKDGALTNPDAIQAQQTYLYEFLNHVNPYTKLAYKDDPNVIAFEVSNEPHHRGNAEDVTKFVKGMVDAMKKTGTKKPIFYNMSHAVHFMDAYFKGGAQGGTFQWYPTGLGYQREVSGNLLPNVNDYNMPFDAIIKKHAGAKLVYEFDAADVGKSYIYPAMARSFRTAGIQIATHFAYDPTFMAANNTEYNTHYMNLNYTPSKALALKICSEVFHEIPMNEKFGTYPQNTTFANFKVDYEKDLAEYISDTKFFYTNSTSSLPENENKLEEIAGVGSSTLVSYNGNGAYFLDKIDANVWRLEIQPDAIWVADPFGRNSPDKTIGVIKWETHTMTLNISGLGTGFKIEAINEGNEFYPKVEGNVFDIRPGTYIISKSGIKKDWSATDDFKTNKLNDFFAPQTTVQKPHLNHEPVEEISECSPLTIKVQFVAPKSPESITVVGYSGTERFSIDLIETKAYQFEATVPEDKLSVGYINYNIIVKTGEEFMTFPAGLSGRSFDWDFYDRTPYRVAVVPKSFPIHLFNAFEDAELLVREWRHGFKLLPTKQNGEAEYQMNIEKLFVVDNENLNAKPIYDYSFKHFIMDAVEGRKLDLVSKKEIVYYGRSLNDKPCKLQIAFVLDDGASYGQTIEIGSELKHYKISLDDLKPVKTVTLPRPYPSFLPYYFEHSVTSGFDINRIESLQFSIGPEIEANALEAAHGISIISVNLE